MNDIGILIFYDNNEFKVISINNIPYNFKLRREKMRNYIEKKYISKYLQVSFTVHFFQ